MKLKFFPVMILTLLCSIPCFSANNDLFIQTEVKGINTDNARLQPVGTSDFITATSLWVRLPVHPDKESSLRIKADAKYLNWSHNSFDDYAYTLIGIDYKKRLGRSRSFNLAYGYAINDSLDLDTPFHQFNGHELTVVYEFPLVNKIEGELSSSIATRKYDSTDSIRDGYGYQIGSLITSDLGDRSRLELNARWNKEDTDDYTKGFSRITVNACITRYLKKNFMGSSLSLDYQYRTTDYNTVGREDTKHAYGTSLKVPIQKDAEFSASYDFANNNSTVDKRDYKVRCITFSIKKKF